MNIAVARKFTPVDPIEDRNSPIHRFFEEHFDALLNAARLLGGREGVNLVEEINDALSRDNDFTRRTVEHLRDLEDLLALENVGDPDRVETGHFALIDILDPVVEEICLLTDGLRAAIAELPKNQSLPREGTHLGRSGHFSRSLCSPADALAFPASGMGDAI